jgi:hypothetical protein
MPETHADIDELSMDELSGVSGSDGVPATTLGGIAGRHGTAITNGGNNRNARSILNGGFNTNPAGSNDGTQQ